MYGEVAGGGDGDGIPERTGEMIAQDCAGETNVLEVPITKPSSGSNRNTNPMQEVYLAQKEGDRKPPATDLIMASSSFTPLVSVRESDSSDANPPKMVLSRTTVLV